MPRRESHSLLSSQPDLRDRYATLFKDDHFAASGPLHYSSGPAVKFAKVNGPHVTHWFHIAAVLYPALLMRR
jgi:hypothetical protein